MHSSAHDDDCDYMRNVFRACLAGNPMAVVLHDVGVFWDVPGLEHHSPDVTVILGVSKERHWGTFHVDEEGVRPALIIEVTSRSTRKNDVVDKVKEYHQGRVPWYVIVDAKELKNQRTLKLIPYQYKKKGYVEMPLDERGRFWLEPVGVWLGVKNGQVVCYDTAGKELEDYPELAARADAAEERLRQLEGELARLRGQTKE